MTAYRQLIDKEIATLTVYGCSAESWNDVLVVENFSPKYISNVHFSGKVYLGVYDKVFELAGGLKKHSGIFNCCLHNCTVGNDVFIDKIHNYIANYQIEEGAYIENVDLIVVEGNSSFGNGVKVPVMIETGGRDIPIFDFLSSAMAYMITVYRHHAALIQNLEGLIEDYTQKISSTQAVIGRNTRIVNCGTLKNVKVGDAAQLEGVTLLNNGSINSNAQAPVVIGYGVQCSNFIICSGASVTESSTVTNCFVGQGTIIGKSFSALDSVFFANCQGLMGEATSIFAGPYTVTHHKSSMLLAGMFSFFNAGSGTNQSNHMYKLGPVHQGVTERGVKTSSDSYLMWPAKIGSFTVVLGRHKGNPDVSDLPFSYLIDSNGESNIMPGINLHSAGTIRDVQKWPKRDNRKDNNKIDAINFDFLSPFTLCKALNGIEILKGLLLNIDEKSSSVWYQNCKIKRSAIKKGIELYEMALYQFIGDQLVKRLSAMKNDSNVDLKQLFSSNEKGEGEWVDLSGLLAPKQEVDKLIEKIADGCLDLEQIQKELNILHNNYGEFAWKWCCDVIEKLMNKSMQLLEMKDVVFLVEQWKAAVSTFDDLILRDAKKEFNSISKISFGMDGNNDTKQLDFEAVRGGYDDNSFIKDINNQLNSCIQIADDLILQIEKIK